MKTYFLDVIFKHYLDFGGRADRKQFWLYVLWCIIVGILASIIFGFLGRLGITLQGLLGLALLCPNLAIATRRLRDGGFSPLWWLLLLLPGIGFLILLIMWILPSK